MEGGGRKGSTALTGTIYKSRPVNIFLSGKRILNLPNHPGLASIQNHLLPSYLPTAPGSPTMTEFHCTGSVPCPRWVAFNFLFDPDGSCGANRTAITLIMLFSSRSQQTVQFVFCRKTIITEQRVGLSENKKKNTHTQNEPTSKTTKNQSNHRGRKIRISRFANGLCAEEQALVGKVWSRSRSVIFHRFSTVRAPGVCQWESFISVKFRCRCACRTMLVGDGGNPLN